MNHLHTSIFHLYFCVCVVSDLSLFNRQRREHRVYEALLQMVPGLEERLMNGNEGDMGNIAELVCPLYIFIKLQI
jgi:hypothetical protein